MRTAGRTASRSRTCCCPECRNIVGLTGHVIFCAEDFTDQHEIYRRDLYFGLTPPDGQRVSLTAPIECAATRAWGVTPAWGTHPRFGAALASLVRKAQRDDD